MSKNKKKISKDLREQRRINEAQKANVASRLNVSYTNVVEAKSPVVAASTVGEKYNLPVDHIKRDLIKNAAYMVFVVVLLAVLKITKISF